MKLFKLNEDGVAHWLVGALVVAVIATIGVRVLTTGHAQTPAAIAGVTVAYSTKQISDCPGVSSVYVPPSDTSIVQQNPSVLSPNGIAPSPAVTNMILADHPKFDKSIACKLNKKVKATVIPQGQCLGGDIINVCPSDNWSGYGSDYSGIEGVIMSWNVPGIQKIYNSNPTYNVPDGWAFSSVWDGIGGGQNGSPTLIQSGTEQNSYCEPNQNCTQEYYPWFEVWPQQAQVQIKDWPISIGDPFFSAVTYSPITNQASFMMCDFANTANQCIVTQENVSGSVGTGAEWVIERPQVTESGTNYEPHLADFGSANITNAQVLTSSDPQWQPMGSNIDIAYDLIDCAGNEIAGGVKPNPGDTSLSLKWDSFGYRNIVPYSLYDSQTIPSYQSQHCFNS